MSTDLNCTSQDGWAGESFTFDLASDTAVNSLIGPEYTAADVNNDNLLAGTEITSFFTAMSTAYGLGTPTTAEYATWAASMASPTVTNLTNVTTAMLKQINTKIATGYPGNKAGVILTFFNSYPNVE